MKKTFLLITGTFFVVIAFAQVEGDVVDQQNKAVTNTIIIATDTVRKTMDTVRTDERGFYYFKELKPGIHKIEANAPGFLPTILFFKVNPAPDGANDTDDTYFAETLDLVLKRPKTPK